MFPVIRRKKMLLGGWSETQEQRRNDWRVAFSDPYQDQYITRSVDQVTVKVERRYGPRGLPPRHSRETYGNRKCGPDRFASSGALRAPGRTISNLMQQAINT